MTGIRSKCLSENKLNPMNRTVSAAGCQGRIGRSCFFADSAQTYAGSGTLRYTW